jgi:hypothetical protein
MRRRMFPFRIPLAFWLPTTRLTFGLLASHFPTAAQRIFAGFGSPNPAEILWKFATSQGHISGPHLRASFKARHAWL